MSVRLSRMGLWKKNTFLASHVIKSSKSSLQTIGKWCIQNRKALYQLIFEAIENLFWTIPLVVNNSKNSRRWINLSLKSLFYTPKKSLTNYAKMLENNHIILHSPLHVPPRLFDRRMSKVELVTSRLTFI